MALDDMAEVGGVRLTPSHQFPLGVSLPSDRRAAVIDWARRTGGVIIEDDYDGEFRYDRSPVGALHGIDPEHVIYMGTVSKSLAPGLRLGWLVLPDHLVEAVARQKGETEETCGFVVQLAMAEFIVSGSYDRYSRNARPVPTRREQLAIAVRASPKSTVAGMPEVCVMPNLPWRRSALARPARVATARRQGLDFFGIPCRRRTRRFGDRWQHSHRVHGQQL
jgi:GntR family transcriptional regulator/MocR family aminotransferase